MFKAFLFLIIAFLILIQLPQACLAGEVEMYPEVRVKENDFIKILYYSIRDPLPNSSESKYSLIKKVIEVKLLFIEYCRATKKESKIDKLAKDSRTSTEDLLDAFQEEVNNMVDYVVPQFRCNNKMKVFLTTYGKDGNEQTLGQYITASPQKLEIYPGETIKTDFYIPEGIGINVENPSFQIWLPK